MLNWLFGKKSESMLGIDLGFFSIKIVELKKKEEQLHLTNYALVQNKEDAVFKIGEIKEAEVADILKTILEQAGMKSRRATISLSVEKTFSTVMELPQMPENELATAIEYEAHKYVPVPLNEVVLDWSIVSLGREKPSVAAAISSDSAKPTGGEKAGIQVLLVAVPKEIINKIVRIVQKAGLELAALEQGGFSLVRSLIGNDKSIYVIVDLGSKSTDLIIVDQGFIRLTHNLESINRELILMEIDKVVNVYQMRYNKKVGQCFLVGGRALEKDLFDFLSGKLKISVKRGDPFARLVAPPQLVSTLKDLGPQMALAVGLAMRE